MQCDTNRKGASRSGRLSTLCLSTRSNRERKTQDEAVLEHVRFQNLRSQSAGCPQRGGIPQAALQSTTGYRSDEMTTPYQQQEAAMTTDQANALEAVLFARKTW